MADYEVKFTGVADVSSIYTRREYDALVKELTRIGMTKEDLVGMGMGTYEGWAIRQTLDAVVEGPTHHNFHRHQRE